MNQSRTIPLFLAFFLLTLAKDAISKESSTPPKLILQITVDQLRADLPLKILNRLPKGGFRYLYEKGTVYANARHEHANTETIIGHTTLATGAQPSVHGMVGNIWYDRSLERVVYNIEDDDYHLLDTAAGVDKDKELDATQKIAKSDGRSPAAIMSTTFSDELSLRYNGQSKIFGVSIKDRGAVSMAGHAGKAFWFSKKTGHFVTSNYYYDKYPAWVSEWNATEPAAKYDGTLWTLLAPEDDYLNAHADDNPWERDMAGFGRTFPHHFGRKESPYFTTLLTLSPAGDELTLDFARALLKNEQLGKDDIPDYLSISFSSTDYVGHFFGPRSLESEDNLHHLDKVLAKLFRLIDEEVGLKNTLIVLSADHGAAEAPERMQKMGVEAARVDISYLKSDQLGHTLETRFGTGLDLITRYVPPYLYLNRSLIASEKIDLLELELFLADEIEKNKNVYEAVPLEALRTGKLPDTEITRSVLNNDNAERSGDLYIVYKPHHYITEFGSLNLSTTHGSPWRYDQSVPVIFAGHRVSRKIISRPIGTVDVAPTLSRYLNINYPSGASGQPLVEIVSK